MNHPAGASLRSVWTIPTQSFSGPHYATYPEKLVEPCIKSGTSEKGECPECGAPWKRVIETTQQILSETGHGSRGDAKRHPAYRTDEPEARTRRINTTLGWQPTCAHDAEPVPQTILDPFSGAGTTGLVAARFGRRYIGIELNPEYAEMSRRRIAETVGSTSPEIADELGVPVQAAMFE